MAGRAGAVVGARRRARSRARAGRGYDREPRASAVAMSKGENEAKRCGSKWKT